MHVKAPAILLFLSAVTQSPGTPFPHPAGAELAFRPTQTAGNAGPLLSNVVASPSSTTLFLTWQTSSPSTSAALCGNTAGNYTFEAVDKGTQANVTAHSSMIAGLSPSTQYFCQVESSDSTGNTSSSLLSTKTEDELPSTPIIGISTGAFTPYNSYGNKMTGDSYYNCVSNDDITYITLDDSNGFGLASGQGANQMLGKLVDESPVIGSNVNFLPAYGAEGAHVGSDNGVAKASGLYCLAGKIYMVTQRVGAYSGLGAVQHSSAQIIASPDHGMTWDNFQTPGLYRASGAMTNPANATMFGSNRLFGASTFVMYGTDDGSLGYRVDNADAYVYMMGNDGYWNNGNALYLARIPRAKLQNLNPADIQYYLGGDGSADDAWSNSIQSTVPVLSETSRMSEPAVQYIPSLNRYLLFEWYYPQSIQLSPANSANTQWTTYEAPHPWGPWKLISSMNWPTQGYYNPVPLQRTALTGTTMTVMSTGNFNADWSTYPNLGANFTYQMFTTPIQILSDNPSEASTGPLDLPSTPKPLDAYSLRRLSRNYSGNAIQVLRWSDGVKKDIGFAASGDLDTATLKAFCGPATCSVAIWYDQLNPGGAASQSVPSKQPVIVKDGTLVTKGRANRPSLLWAPGSVGFMAASTVSGSQLEAITVASLDSSAPSWSVLLEAWDGSGDNGTSSVKNADLFLRHGTNNGISSIRKYAEDDGGTIPMSSLFWADSQFTGSLMNLYVGANPVVTCPYTGSFGSKFLMIGSADGGSSTYAMQGNISELLVFSTNVTAAAGHELYSNQQAYYGW